MLDTIRGSRATAVAQTVGHQVWDRVTESGENVFSIFRGQTSSRSIEAKLEQGRSNAVRMDLYNGTRTEMFDAPALFCYLVENAEHQGAPGMEGACDLFESVVGQLPVSVRRRAIRRFNESGISAAPDGDDLKRAAALDMLVDEITQECLAMQQRAASSEAGRTSEDQPVEQSGLPVVVESAD